MEEWSENTPAAARAKIDDWIHLISFLLKPYDRITAFLAYSHRIVKYFFMSTDFNSSKGMRCH